MKADALIDMIAGHRKAIGENFEVLILDPRAPIGKENAEWTPDFLPVPQTYTHGDGRLEAICLLLPHPTDAMVDDGSGTLRPFAEPTKEG